jgi:hypothetical protein
MAGQADRSSTGQTGPAARRPAAGRSRSSAGRPEYTPVPVEVGGVAEPFDAAKTAAPAADPIRPDLQPRSLQTQAAYRFLITSGISGPDAAGLISYVVGLPNRDSRWSLNQVNRLLFLRALYASGTWADAERRPD